MQLLNPNHHLMMMMKNSVYDSMAHVNYSPEYDPQSIMNYYSSGVHAGRCTNPHVKNLIMKAKNHLYAVGWTFFYVFKNTGTKELRYKAPTGRVYVSLRTACECAIKNQEKSKKGKSESFSSFDHAGSSKIEVSTEPVKESGSFSCVDRPQKKACVEDVKSLCFDQKSVKDSSVFDSNVKQDVKRSMLTGKKDSSPKKPRLLGSLIEKNIVKRGARVSYLSRKDGSILKRGRFYEDGIKCDCCDEIFLLTKFEAHAGSTNHRPAANLFFDDNRSILDCQTQLERENLLPADDKSSTDVCRLCHQGQPSNLSSEADHDLIKCSLCQRHFHISCVSNLGFVVCFDDPARWICTDKCERMYFADHRIKLET